MAPHAQLSDASRRMLGVYSWPAIFASFATLSSVRWFFSRSSVLGPRPAGCLEPRIFGRRARCRFRRGQLHSGLRSLEEVEREVIRRHLKLPTTDSRSAEALGISRKTLLEKRKKYGLK